ncbi:DUF4113 domain-containing protein [Pseudomonas sp.]
MNGRKGKGAVRFGRVPEKPKWAMRRDVLSPRYTTRWDRLTGV